MKIKKFPKSHVKCNYAYISFLFQARKQETKQSAKRDERKGEDEIKTESAIAFTRNKSSKNIINNDEWYIRLLHYMLSVGKGKNYSRSNEFCQIICPLNEQSQIKQNFGKIFKIQVFKVDNNSNGISGNRNVKIDKISRNKWE